jgi:hypothetical protein
MATEVALSSQVRPRCGQPRSLNPSADALRQREQRAARRVARIPAGQIIDGIKITCGFLPIRWELSYQDCQDICDACDRWLATRGIFLPSMRDLISIQAN